MKNKELAVVLGASHLILDWWLSAVEFEGL